MSVNIGGQEVEITDGGNFKIHIRSIFRSAGLLYKFMNNCAGIGINEEIVKKAIEENRYLIIRVGDSEKLYTIKPEKVLEIAKEHNSEYYANGIILYVISLKELHPIV